MGNNRRKNTDWRETYWQVLFAADPEKLQTSIEVAHEAVKRRICTLWDVQPPDMGELNQLAYASYTLGLLKQHGWGAQAKTRTSDSPPVQTLVNLAFRPVKKK